MTRGKALVEGALALERTERVPVFHQYLAGGPGPFNAIGLEMEECYRDAEKLARACKAVRDAYGYDNIMAGWGCIVLEAHAHGTEIAFVRPNAYPQSTSPLLEDPAAIESLEPVDPFDNDLLRNRLEASRLLVERHGEDYAVMGNMLAPAVVAWELRGYEGYLMDMFFDKELAHRYLKVISESLAAQGERLSEAGVDIVFLEDDFTAGQEYAPLESMRECDLDYAAPAAKRLQRQGHRLLLHNCTKRPLVEEQVEAIRPEAVHYNADNVEDHADMCARLRGEVCLCPGVDEGLVYEGPPSLIEETVWRLAADVRDHDAFMMAAAYEVPFRTKAENHAALVEAVKGLRP